MNCSERSLTQTKCYAGVLPRALSPGVCPIHMKMSTHRSKLVHYWFSVVFFPPKPILLSIFSLDLIAACNKMLSTWQAPNKYSLNFQKSFFFLVCPILSLHSHRLLPSHQGSFLQIASEMHFKYMTLYVIQGQSRTVLCSMVATNHMWLFKFHQN